MYVCAVYFGAKRRKRNQAVAPTKKPNTVKEIINNIFKNNTYGIRFWHTTGGEVYQNIISNNDYGIFLEFADHLSIDRNCIHNDSTGIICDTSDSIDISHNDIRHCNIIGIYILRGIDSKNVNNINKNN